MASRNWVEYEAKYWSSNECSNSEKSKLNRAELCKPFVEILSRTSPRARWNDSPRVTATALREALRVSYVEIRLPTSPPARQNYSSSFAANSWEAPRVTSSSRRRNSPAHRCRRALRDILFPAIDYGMFDDAILKARGSISIKTLPGIFVL
eukprot:8392546-Pyramimonas_sp.AAC.1